MAVRTTGQVLWNPPADVRETTQLGRFLDFLRDTRGRDLAGYDELFAWSVADLEGFWGALWDFFGVRAHTPYDRVLGAREMPGAEWFSGARLNYAEHMLGADDDLGAVAVLARSQTRDPFELTFGDLREQVARARAGLQRLGVGPGDRVVAYLPNIPETLIAFLATASLGAVWATCATEFGPRSVIARFGIVEPKVLLAVAGYRYGDKRVDRRPEVAAVRAALPTLEHVVHVPYVGGEDDALPDALGWDELLAERGPLAFDPVPFNHPLYVLFSSGTTGLPKPIVHGHGGILVEHFKNHGLSWDLQPRRPADVVHDDRLDDVERARLHAAAARLDRDARRQPAVPRHGRAVAAGGGDAADAHGRRPGAADGLPQGGAAGRRVVRPVVASGSWPRRARRCPARGSTGCTSSSGRTCS